MSAQDAAAAADSWALREAVAEGRARIWGTKDQFGRLFARSEVGLLALVDESLARSVFGAIAMALLVQGNVSGSEPANKGLNPLVNNDMRSPGQNDAVKAK